MPDVLQDGTHFVEIERRGLQDHLRGLGVAQDGPERLAQLVGQGRRHLSHRGDSRHMGKLEALDAQLLFHPLALRDILDNPVRPHGSAARAVAAKHSPAAHPQPSLAPALEEDPELQVQDPAAVRIIRPLHAAKEDGFVVWMDCLGHQVRIQFERGANGQPVQGQ